MTDNIEIEKKIKILSNKLNLGNFDEVIANGKSLLKKNKHQVIFNILSLAYQSKGEFEKSETIMDEALQLNPNNPYFLNNMGITQHKMGNLKIAEEYFLRGLKIVPNYINILNNLGNLKKDLDQTEEALNYYKKSLSINPKIIQTLLNISICYQSMGKFDESIKNLNDLLKVEPRFTIADRLIASMTRYYEENTHLKNMEKKISQLKLTDIQFANLFFSLGKAYEDLKKYDQSFQNYKKGNDILRKNSNFNIHNEIKDFENIKKIFSRNFEKNIKLKKTRKIIFIVGMPRSGTSLIEQILSSHKIVYGGGELIFLKDIIEKNFFIKNNGKDLDISDFSDDIFYESHNEYIKKISQIDDSQKVFTDKTPLNFKYIGFIKKIFPSSKIINCNRNSLDICWSNFKNYFGESLPFSNNLKDLAEYYKIYEDLIQFWENKLPDQIYQMNYNQLINEPEKEIRNILNFCQLEWDSNCLKHEKNTKTIKTASASQARKPINKSGLKTFEPFKNYLTEISNILKN